MLRAGPFHTALRWAIADRGLSLDRLRDRLTGAGLSVSVATLSNWQRGVSRPDRAESLRVLAELETVLRLPPGSLGRLLDEPAHQGRPRALVVPGTSLVVAQRLRAALDASAEPGLDVLAVQEDVTVLGPGHWHSTVRVAVRARQAGVRRHVVLNHTQGSVPIVRAGRDCALGRARTDQEAGLVATELVFPALGRGEEYALLYHVSGAVTEPYHGMWLRAGQHFDMTLRFGPDAGVERAYRIWRLDPRSPHKDLTRLRLFDSRRVHLIDHDVTPGFHGIRWSWPNSGNS